jgi:hypothetical protein
VPCSDSDLLSKIAFEMLEVDNCFPVFFKFDGKFFTRLSAQIYNEMSDYEFMANTFLSYLKGIKKLRSEKEKSK